MRGDGRRVWLGEESLLLLQEGESLRRGRQGRFEAASATAASVEAWALKAKRGGFKLLKESEKRKVRDRVRSDFAPALDDEALLDLLVPSGKARQLGCCRIETKRKGRLEVYAVDDRAVLVSQESHDLAPSLVPTLWALRRCPHLLRQLAMYAPVKKNVLRGAELFFPGVAGALELASASASASGGGNASWPRDLCGGPFLKGELVALVVEDDEQVLPVAVGRFAVSDDDALERGLTGSVVDCLFRQGDALWTRFGVQSSQDEHDDASACAAVVVEGLGRVLAKRADRAAEILELQRDRAEAERAAQAAMALDQLRKDLRRIEKALRQIDDLKKAGVAPKNDDQRSKLDREASLRAELDDIRRRLTVEEDLPVLEEQSTEREPLPGEEHEPAASATVVHEEPTAADDAQRPPGAEARPPTESSSSSSGSSSSGEHAEPTQGQQGQESQEEETAADPADDPGAAAEEESVDDRFKRAFLTVLDGSYFPQGRQRKTKGGPFLANEIFAATAKLAGRSVKETRWKKAARFLAEEGPFVVSRERAPGVAEIVDVDWSRAPAFRRVEPLGDEDADDTAERKLPRAKKRGGRVVVSLRRVRNKNCTFVDGLDGWGYTEADMRDLAAAFRTRFSASSSVAPRKGTEDNKAGKQFWSVMVQGKYADQIAHTLRTHLGVTDVAVQAQKGMLTKLDRAANV